MPYLKFFIFGFFIFAIWLSDAFAQDIDDKVRLLDVEQFTPVLTLNKSPKICTPYLKAWTTAYKGEKRFYSYNIIEGIQGAKNIKLVFGKNAYTSLDYDYDNDGNEEVFYVEYIDPPRYAGTQELFFYKSRADLDADFADTQGKSRRRNPNRSGNIFAKRGVSLGNFPQSVRLFSFDGEIYVHDPTIAHIDLLKFNASPARICELNIETPRLKENLKIDILHKLSMVAGKGYEEKHGERCENGLRGRYLEVETYLPTLLHRPQAMRNKRGGEIDMSPAAEAGREFLYASWGSLDPTSYEVVKDIKTQYPKFVDEFSLYYQIYFDMEAQKAREVARMGYRYLLDNVYFAKQMGHNSEQIFGKEFEAFDIGPETSLENLADLAIQNAIEVKDTNSTILKLGLLTGRDANRLKILSEHTLDLKRRFGANYNKTSEKQRQPLLNDLFLASLKHPEMMKHFLKLGAKADISTNFFGKTALMYAAQNNDLAAVDLLLSEGADPNRKTQVINKPCRLGLERDSRTPLMYAVENANRDLILKLLKAGADPQATDSKGNKVSWYLARNSHLLDAQKEEIKIHLRKN